jgi:hypothetical protein
MTVVASPGWQTQVFLTVKRSDPVGVSGLGDPADGELDLATAAILMSRLGDGYRPNDETAKTVELTKLALEDGRAVIPSETLLQMVHDKFENPMLGILGAHGLFRSGERDSLRSVVENLRQLVGEHPDVESLSLALDGGSSIAEWTTPPMLSSSWSQVVGAATRQPDLVPAGSLAERVSTNLWGSSAWLIWLADSLDPPNPTVDPSSVTEVLGTLVSLGAEYGQTVGPDQLDEFKEVLLGYVDNLTKTTSAGWQLDAEAAGPIVAGNPELAGFGDAAAALVDDTNEEAPSLDQQAQSLIGALATVMQVPPSAVEAMATSLATTLTELSGPELQAE